MAWQPFVRAIARDYDGRNDETRVFFVGYQEGYYGCPMRPGSVPRAYSEGYGDGVADRRDGNVIRFPARKKRGRVMSANIKPRGPVRIIVSEDSEGNFWIKKGKVSVHAHDHESALRVAQRLFEEKGGEGKAVIIDLTKHRKASSDA